MGCIAYGYKGKILILQDVKQNNGKEVTVIGTYQKAFLNQNPNDTSFHGLYKVEVNDSLSVILLPPYDPKSKRPPEEVARWEDRKVKVTGTICDRTYMEKP